jgi:hypothetical protein
MIHCDETPSFYTSLQCAPQRYNYLMLRATCLVIPVFSDPFPQEKEN